MISPTVEAELREQLEQMPPEKQQRVVEFARELARSKPKGVPGRDLLRFAGTIERDDLELMARAIEEDCERVDVDGW